ncbi:hypothetical protein MNEG_15501, partial [Monoraphidium neglectum]
RSLKTPSPPLGVPPLSARAALLASAFVLTGMVTASLAILRRLRQTAAMELTS